MTRKEIEILREHYVGKGKPRVIALYTELTSLTMSEDCPLTDYALKRRNGGAVHEICRGGKKRQFAGGHAIEGPTKAIQHFKTVVTQRERDISFTEFKVALRRFEETEKCQQPSASGVTDRVMTAQPTQRTRSGVS